MAKLRTTLVVLFSCVVLFAIGYGFHGTLRSPLFFVKIVEVADLPENAPVDAQTITKLAAVPVGETSLFDLDLSRIEQRIASNPWVREVSLSKRFPQTLSISIVFREPKALIQARNGTLAYVDTTGKIFGEVNLMQAADLPVVYGVPFDQEGLVRDGLRIIEAWNGGKLSRASQLAALSWDEERGYRAIAVYAMKPGAEALEGAQIAKARPSVELGHEIDGGIGSQLARLERVFNYLSENSIPARQIFADAGKKIVVKTSTGS